MQKNCSVYIAFSSNSPSVLTIFKIWEITLIWQSLARNMRIVLIVPWLNATGILRSVWAILPDHNPCRFEISSAKEKNAAIHWICVKIWMKRAKIKLLWSLILLVDHLKPSQQITFAYTKSTTKVKTYNPEANFG